MKKISDLTKSLKLLGKGLIVLSQAIEKEKSRQTEKIGPIQKAYHYMIECIADPNHPNHRKVFEILQLLSHMRHQDEQRKKNKDLEDCVAKVKNGDLDYQNDESGEIQ